MRCSNPTIKKCSMNSLNQIPHSNLKFHNYFLNPCRISWDEESLNIFLHAVHTPTSKWITNVILIMTKNKETYIHIVEDALCNKNNTKNKMQISIYCPSNKSKVAHWTWMASPRPLQHLLENKPSNLDIFISFQHCLI